MKHTDNSKGVSANKRHLKLKQNLSFNHKMTREGARLAHSNSCNCSQRNLQVMHLGSFHKKKLFKAVGLQLFFDDLFKFYFISRL